MRLLINWAFKPITIKREKSEHWQKKQTNKQTKHEPTYSVKWFMVFERLNLKKYLSIEIGTGLITFKIYYFPIYNFVEHRVKSQVNQRSFFIAVL